MKKTILNLLVTALCAHKTCAAQTILPMINLETHLPAIAPTNVPIKFILVTNGQMAWTTNGENLKYRWDGLWREGGNGLRVQLELAPMSDGMRIGVNVGSAVSNSTAYGAILFSTPNGKFTKFELVDSNGVVLRPKKSAGTDFIPINGLIYKPNLPKWAAPTPGSLVADFPPTISTNVYPYSLEEDTGCFVGFKSYRDPDRIAIVNLNEQYSIKHEGDYTLTIQPVLYKARFDDSEFLDRVDLPSVTTKVHLVPNVK